MKYATNLIEEICGEEAIHILDCNISEYIEPAFSGDATKFAYAVCDDYCDSYEWPEGVEFIQGSHRYLNFEADPETWIEGFDKETHKVFVVGAYEHGQIQWGLSGESMHSNDMFDYASVAGFIAIPLDFTNPEDAARNILRDYTDWCNGEVYGVVLVEKEGDEWLETDSCFGYIGSEYTEATLKEMVQ